MIVSSFSDLHDARSVHVLSDHAYVADSAAGIFAIDIRNLRRPQIAGSVKTAGEAQGVYPLYSLLIVADGSNGLQLIDIRNPASMGIAGAYVTPGEARSVYGSGSRVYVTGRGFALGVFEVFDRSRLHPNGRFLVDRDR
jgi:hypothetical protein